MAATPQGSRLDQEDPLRNPESSLSYPIQASSDDTVSLAQSDQRIFEHKKSIKTVAKVFIIGFAALLMFAGIVFFLFYGRESAPSLQSGSFNEINLPLKKLAINDSLQGTQSLKVRGQLEVANALTISPSEQPKNPTSGQLYFDKTLKQMRYYDGTQFVLLQGGAGATINNVTNGSTISNVTNGGSITNVFNTQGGGPTLTGTAGNLAMFTSDSSLGNSLIQQSGTNLQVASSGSTAVTVGSNAGTSSTVIQGGTGNLTMATGSASGITGSISITTGDSSTTASGNISIDSGSGIIDGEVIEDKTFESGLDNMQDWFNTSLATTTAQAHSGLQSLQVTPSSAFWGVIEIFPGTAVTPGHQYHFSIWLRAATSPRTITAKISWQGSGVVTSFTPAVDSTTGWTETTLTAPAPAGATSAAFEIQTSSGAAGDIHYIDDMTITDLSSGTAISSLDIGSTNAKVITIGNLNQIGATTIRGGSGVNIQSGAASTVINGGSLSLTGNAASTLNTTSGALTIASAATTTWGISTAASGVGGDLTLHGGQGGSDTNNDGGDLILQGGARNGTGVPGSVIVKPPSDVTDAFQIQNSSGTPFLVADSSGMKITVAGTTAAFALLNLDNAHVRSTQTNPPTIGAPANCGTTPTTAITAGSTDTAGSFSITTGTGGSSTTCDATITFNKAYTGAPKLIIVVGKTDAASAARQIYVSSSSTSTFTTAFGVSTGGTNSTTYSFSYWIVE